MTIAYRYDPSKGTFSGVPARDLTQAQFVALGPREQRIVRLSGAYTEAAPAPDIKDMKRAGIDPGEHSNRESLIAALSETEG